MPNIKYSKIKDYIEALEKLINKYSTLFFCNEFVHEYIDLDVQTVFKKAWIDPK